MLRVQFATQIVCTNVLTLATAGSSITTHYVSPLLDITARRARLREKWFFDCSCARCEDTTGTDLGTFLSALRCPACTAGFSLPVLSEAPAQFRCEVCRHSLPAAQALHTIKMWEPLIQVSSLSFRASVSSLLGFFQARLGQSLNSIFTDLFHFNFTSPLVSSGWSPSPL